MTNEQAAQALNDWLETLKREHGKDIQFVITYPPVVPLLLAQAGIQETAPPAVTVAFGDVAGWMPPATLQAVEAYAVLDAAPSDNGRYKVAPPP